LTAVLSTMDATHSKHSSHAPGGAPERLRVKSALTLMSWHSRPAKSWWR